MLLKKRRANFRKVQKLCDIKKKHVAYRELDEFNNRMAEANKIMTYVGFTKEPIVSRVDNL
jgi:hypothetical protein